jgi:hypothetical protein
MFFHGIQTGFRNAFDAEPFTDFFCRSISVVVRAFAFDLSDLWGFGLTPPDSDLPLLCTGASKNGSKVRRRKNGISSNKAKNRTQPSLTLRFRQEIQTLPWEGGPEMSGVRKR